MTKAELTKEVRRLRQENKNKRQAAFWNACSKKTHI